MTDGQAILRTIVENPHDDAPRLVYADWLEEHGRVERAEFIRLQCALDRMSPAEKQAHFNWSARAKALWDRHRSEWLAELPQPTGVDWFTEFRRGFPHGISFAHVRAFEDAADLVFAAAPVVHIDVSDVRGIQVEAISESPYAPRLLRLDLFYSHIGPHGAFVLATSPRLRGLRQLHLASNQIRDEGAEHLAKSASLAGLKSLVLVRNGIGTTGGRALAAALYLSRALKLYLRYNHIDPDTLSRLRDRFPRLVV
jgi:uncharacterized protein (TIGR02996 family)